MRAHGRFAWRSALGAACALLALLALLAQERRAQASGSREERGTESFHDFRYQGLELLEMSGGVTNLDTADGVFVGSGRLTPGGPRVPFRATGRELGLIHPTGGYFDMSVRYMVGPLLLGGMFGVGGLGQDGEAATTGVASLANGGSSTFYMAAAEAGLEARLASLRVRGVARLGHRWIGVTMDGFAPVGRSAPTATWGATWVQARLEVLHFWNLGSSHEASESGFGLGPFAAVDAAPAFGWSAGLSFMMRIVDGPDGL